jgi:hypothetical protein
MNSKLYGNYYNIPENILNHLEKFSGSDTINNLISSKKISYSNIKKIIHDMENGELNELGGDYFKNYLTNFLSSEQRSSEPIKDKMKINSKERNNYELRSSKKHKKTSEKHDTSIDTSFVRLESRVIEELKQINDILKKII